MPRAVSMKIKSRQETEEFISSPELSEDEIPVKNCEKPNIKSDKTITIYETDAKSGGTDCAVVNNKNTDFGNDLRKMLDVFGTDVSKALQAKKQRLEQYTAGAMKANEAKLKEMLQYQSEARRHHEEMVRNVNSVLEQWNVDLAQSKDQEEKMIKIVHKQIEIIQQNRASQLQRLASLRQIHESYQKNFLQQEAKQNEQCGNVLQELRKELTELQKKMMIDSQKEELAQMQEFLQKSMLFM